MAFQTMKMLLPQRLRQTGIERDVRVAQTLALANEILDEWFGPQTSQTRAQAVSIKFKQLCIASLDASLRQDLKFRERDLVNAINTRVGAQAVESLKLMI